MENRPLPTQVAIPGTSRDKVTVETLRRTLPRLTARAQPWNSVALESQLSTPSQVSKQRAASAPVLIPEATSTRNCRLGRGGRKGSALPRLPPVGTSASAQSVQNWRPPIPEPPTPPGSNSLVTPLRGPLDQPEPWHAGEGGAGSISPEMCAGVVEPLDGKRVIVGCAWERGADPWLKSGSQLSWLPHSRLNRRGARGMVCEGSRHDRVVGPQMPLLL